MTPQEKSKELIDSYESKLDDIIAVDGGGWENCSLVEKSVKEVAVKCALKAANEVLLVVSGAGLTTLTQYWIDVKEGIFKYYKP